MGKWIREGFSIILYELFYYIIRADALVYWILRFRLGTIEERAHICGVSHTCKRLNRCFSLSVELVGMDGWGGEVDSFFSSGKVGGWNMIYS